MREDFTDEHKAWCNGGRRRVYAVEDQHKYCGRIQNGTKCVHSVHGRPTLKDEKRFRNGLVRKPYERSLYERTIMSEPFVEKHAISTELCNANREKHKLKSHRVCRRDREPSRIPIRSLKSLRNKSRKVREFVYARILSCFPMSSTLYCYVNAKNIFKKRSLCSVVVDLVKV